MLFRKRELKFEAIQGECDRPDIKEPKLDSPINRLTDLSLHVRNALVLAGIVQVKDLIDPRDRFPYQWLGPSDRKEIETFLATHRSKF